MSSRFAPQSNPSKARLLPAQYPNTACWQLSLEWRCRQRAENHPPTLPGCPATQTTPSRASHVSEMEGRVAGKHFIRAETRETASRRGGCGGRGGLSAPHAFEPTHVTASPRCVSAISARSSPLSWARPPGATAEEAEGEFRPGDSEVQAGVEERRDRRLAHGGDRGRHQGPLSHRVYSLNGFRKSTPPQNRRLIVSISHSQHFVDLLTGGIEGVTKVL